MRKYFAFGLLLLGPLTAELQADECRGRVKNAFVNGKAICVETRPVARPVICYCGDSMNDSEALKFTKKKDDVPFKVDGDADSDVGYPSKKQIYSRSSEVCNDKVEMVTCIDPKGAHASATTLMIPEEYRPGYIPLGLALPSK